VHKTLIEDGRAGQLASALIARGVKVHAGTRLVHQAASASAKGNQAAAVLTALSVADSMDKEYSDLECAMEVCFYFLHPALEVYIMSPDFSPVSVADYFSLKSW
jgi:hypothetical protein